MQLTSSELTSNPSELLRIVDAGETVTIVEDGVAIAEVKPIQSVKARTRPYGLAAGTFDVPDDFDAPLDESILEDFGV